MPFKSQSQRRWMYAAAARGEVPKSMPEHWSKATPKGKKLPEKVASAETHGWYPKDEESLTHLRARAKRMPEWARYKGITDLKRAQEMFKRHYGEKVASASVSDENRKKIRDYVRSKKGLSDKKFHEHSRRLGVKNDRAEEVAYAEARALHGGKAEEPGAKKPSPQQMAMGARVEREHTHKPAVAREIASDHLAEIPDYYSRLKKMEAEAKMKKSAAFTAGIKTAILDEMYYGLRLSEDARVAEEAELARMEPGERERYLADMSARNARVAMTNPASK
jgi:hypothetical protein